MAPTPQSAMTGCIDRQFIGANLEYDIEQQLDDGIWSLDWSWQQIDPEAWKVAEKEWKVHLTIGKLETLHAYGHL
jgi:hypothetical protein